MTEQRQSYTAGDTPETFTLDNLSRLELVSLNRGLSCWLAELRLKRYQAEAGSELAQTIDQASEVAAGVLRRVDKMLGIT